MILTVNEVKKLLVGVLEKTTGLPSGRVIIEGDGETGPRPPGGLYCSLWWHGFEPLPQNQGDYRDAPDPDGTGKAAPIIQTLRNETYCTVQVTFWGAKALEMAAATVGELQNDNRNFDLWRVLGYGGIDNIQDISAAFGGHVQGRCFFNLSFYACFGVDYPVEWFDTSQWVIAYARQDDKFAYSKEIHDEPKSRCVY